MPETENNNQNGRYTYNSFNIPQVENRVRSISLPLTASNPAMRPVVKHLNVNTLPTKDTEVYGGPDFVKKDFNFAGDANNWLSKWYSNPVTQQIIQQTNKENGIEDDYFTKDLQYTDENGIVKNYTPSVKEGMIYRTIVAGNTPQYSTNRRLGEGNARTLGAFTGRTQDPKFNFSGVNGKKEYVGNYIVYGDEYNNPWKYNDSSVNWNHTWVPFHELNHAYQYNLIPKFGKDTENNAHDDRDREKHSYLMSLRAGFNLDPAKRDYTEEDAQKMIDAVNAEKENYIDRNGGNTSYSDYYDMEDHGARLIKAIGGNASTLQNMLNTWPAFQDPAKAKRDLQLRFKLGGKLKSWFK